MRKLILFLFVAVLLMIASPAFAQHQATLSWTPPVGCVGGATPCAAVTSYQIFRATTAGAEGTTPYATVTVAAPVTCPSGTPVGSACFIDTAVTAGTTYFYKVAAVNSAGPSAQSTEVSATIPNPQPPLPPSNVAVTSS